MQRFWCFLFFILICLVGNPAWANEISAENEINAEDEISSEDESNSEEKNSFESIFSVGITQAYTTQMISGKSHFGGYAVEARGGFRFDQWGGFMEMKYVGLFY